MIDPEPVRRRFKAAYGTEPRLFWAPGRVNLIGEHTDYNDGLVLPMAIDRGTIVGAIARGDRRIRVLALDLGELREFDLDGPAERRRGIWLDYVEGIARTLEARGQRLVGADLAVHGSVPLGAGLASSASLEISTGLALLSVANQPHDRMALALAGQAAEHDYVGTRCGIMDQAVAVLAQQDHALLLDCRSLSPQLVPLDSSRTVVVLCDSRVKHHLAASAYNTRRSECERAVELLRPRLPSIRALRDVSVQEMDDYGALLPEPIRRRARHVVTENARTLVAAAALSQGDFKQAGRLMLASHMSLRNDYEVSAPELDVLVEAASSVPGVFGARLTGGGFGGCTVNLATPDSVPELQRALHESFSSHFGRVPSIFVSQPECGAREIG